MNLNALLNSLDEFESAIGYCFKNRKHAILALTHSSYANEKKGEGLKSNERLEFLGDAVLNLTISERIYAMHPDLSEGEMTKARANIVCEASLVKCSEKVNLGKYLMLGKGEEMTGGRTRVSILSDAFEALIGAIYIDRGMKNAKEFIYSHMENIIEESVKGTVTLDYKTQLQELVQKNGESRISYEIIQEKGPDHNKLFVSQVKINDNVMGIGEGKSKKIAEQNASRVALEKLSNLR